MTTVIFVKKECFVCGATGSYAEVGIKNIGKPHDLDGRPDDSHRSALYMLMQQCQYCGYCSPDISLGPSRAADTVNDTLYKQQLTDKTFPDTANKFLCWSIIQKKGGIFNEAGRATLYAAWICDDDNEFHNKALECRREAIHCFQKARELNQSFSNTELEEQLLIIDLMRLCGLFEEARTICKEERKKPHSEKESLIIMFQEDLITEKDQCSHTTSEAISI